MKFTEMYYVIQNKPNGSVDPFFSDDGQVNSFRSAKKFGTKAEAEGKVKDGKFVYGKVRRVTVNTEIGD